MTRTAVVLAFAFAVAACGLAPNVPNPAHLWTRDWLTGQRPTEGAVRRDGLGNPILPGAPSSGTSASRASNP